MDSPADLGASWRPPNRCHFRVWAPRAARVTLRLVGGPERAVALHPTPHGYFEADLDGVRPGQRYLYRLDDRLDRPDPASRWQPDGVHGPSAVTDPAFDWHDADWHGRALADYVIYELHIGTFTPAGTFDAAIDQLDRLRELGVTAVEVMPVAQFPGARNWGYDGAYPFAVQNSYGGPAGFKRFIDACHARGLAVVLDVVYNHFGPEGNYTNDFGPYYTDHYKVPWGDALNFDGRGSDEVRHFFLSNALYWQTEFHVDGLRLDAAPCIKDHTSRHFLAELSDVTRQRAERLGRPLYLIGEIDANDVRYLRPEGEGGLGLSAQWADDFHHALHALLTGERTGYYADYGTLDHLARAYRDGFAYTGQFSPYRGRRHGNSPRGRPAEQFVFCVQNHDQVGNRARGERLGALTDFAGLKLAAGLLLLSPYVPLLFMGEEYAEEAPFLYFTSHTDPALAAAVTAGRRREFAAFAWQGEVPDPQDEATFLRSKLRAEAAGVGKGRVLSEFYRELLRLRREVAALARADNGAMEVVGFEERGALFVRRWAGDDEVVIAAQVVGDGGRAGWPVPAGAWRKLLDSAEPRWLGPRSAGPDRLDSGGDVSLTLPPRTIVVYRRDRP